MIETICICGWDLKSALKCSKKLNRVGIVTDVWPDHSISFHRSSEKRRRIPSRL